MSVVGVFSFCETTTGTTGSVEIEEGATSEGLGLIKGFISVLPSSADHKPLWKVPFLESGRGNLTFLLLTDFFTYFLSLMPREGASGR